MKLQSVSCAVFQSRLCNQRGRASRHEHIESSRAVTAYRICAPTEITLHSARRKLWSQATGPRSSGDKRGRGVAGHLQFLHERDADSTHRHQLRLQETTK